jgi:O-acetyl-ADP-ribose deacetylase (regulator of RNase III)
MINEVNGNLIKLAKEGKFDVVAHGCNCFCTMKQGIAPQMAAAFSCDKYILEAPEYRGDINKLGQLDYDYWINPSNLEKSFCVVNMYTQYHWYAPSRFGIPLDYTALEMCLVKMNHRFLGGHIGLPKIGCGKARGDWKRVSKIIENTLKDCTVTIVNYLP